MEKHTLQRKAKWGVKTLCGGPSSSEVGSDLSPQAISHVFVGEYFLREGGEEKAIFHIPLSFTEVSFEPSSLPLVLLVYHTLP